MQFLIRSSPLPQREWYVGILSDENGGLTDRGYLTLDQDANGQPTTYVLDEYYFDGKSNEPVRTVTSTGHVSVEHLIGDEIFARVCGAQRELTVYRLDGGANADRARSFVRVGNALRVLVVDDRGKAMGGNGHFKLDRVAAAATGTVMVTDHVDNPLVTDNYRVTLQVG